MKKAFTMIELIFVIVIIGILAAVAIPKLAATRDDAKTAKAIMNLGTCVQDVGTRYTSQSIDSVVGLASCTRITNAGCWVISDDGDNDGNITITANNTNTESWCVSAQSQALLIVLVGTHVFGGGNIRW